MLRLPSALRVHVFKRLLQCSPVILTAAPPRSIASLAAANLVFGREICRPLSGHQVRYATVLVDDPERLWSDNSRPPVDSNAVRDKRSSEEGTTVTPSSSTQNNKPQPVKASKFISISAVEKDTMRTRRSGKAAKKEAGIEEVEQDVHAEPNGTTKILDVQHILKRFSLPRAEDYHDAPADLFDPVRCSSAINNICMGYQLSMKADVEYSMEKKLSSSLKTSHNGLEHVKCCTLRLSIESVCEEEAYGEGSSKQLAKQAAWLHMLSKMHEKDALKRLLNNSEEGHSKPAAPPVRITSDIKAVKLDDRLVEIEKDAKTDIYNYAASAGLVPHFQIERVQPPRPHNRRGRNAATPKPLIRVTITLPEQHIEASATAKSLEVAEIAAALAFKKKAEDYELNNNDEQRATSSYSILSADNARSFFDYLKIVRPRTRLEVEHEQLDSSKLGDSQTRTWVTVDDEEVGEAVTMLTKKKAEKVAWLTAAVGMSRRDPQLLPDFQRFLKKGKGSILRPVSAIDLSVSEEIQRTMRDTMLEARNAGLPDTKEILLAAESLEAVRRRPRTVLTSAQIERINHHSAQKLTNYLTDPKLEDLRSQRKSLPMNQYRKQVTTMIGSSLYSIVVGATGSGKTTQVPQILLDGAIADGQGGACNIICTQPRRIAATSVAQRVAAERNERICESIGYQVRFDAKIPCPGGSVTYCTTGILLEQLKHAADEVFDTTSHLIIDEVHERDLNIDFLMIILKKAIKARQAAGKTVPRVVLMSATLDTELFSKYFRQHTNAGQLMDCPSLSVPGRTFPVKERFFTDIMQDLEKTYPSQLQSLFKSDRRTVPYVEGERAFSSKNSSVSGVAPAAESIIDWKRERHISSDGEAATGAQEQEESLVPISLVAATIAHICNTSQDGAILVFFPGLDEIMKTQEIFKKQSVLGKEFMDERKFKICLLHSSVPKKDQDEVFSAVPSGCRKIILSTNIAETSVTIPDVQYVVDTGKLREKRYDHIRRITKLQCTWISKSNSKQRAGRAGRVQNGNYYALFSRERYESLRAIGLPELLRSDLQETCLSIKAQAFDEPIQSFLAQAIEPPSPQAIDASVDNLKALEALTEDEELTALGQLLAKLPVHPTLGKMIVLGVIFRCLDPMLILGAAAEERSMFVTPIERRVAAKEAHSSYGGQKSDHLALLSAFKEMRSIWDEQGEHSARRRAGEKFLHFGAFRTIDQTARQIEEILVGAGLIPYTSPRQRNNGKYGHLALNRNSDNAALVKGLILAGYRPNLAIKSTSHSQVHRTPTEQNVLMHPSSLNMRPPKQEQHPYGALFAYSTLSRGNDGNALFMRDTTLTDPLTAAIFGGKLRIEGFNRLEMDEWLPFFVKAERREFATKLVLEFRKTLDRILSGAFQSLSNLRAEDEGYLADDEVRERFASGLVEVLDPRANANAPGVSSRVPFPSTAVWPLRPSGRSRL